MLRREDTVLVVVDVQEGFRKVIPDFDSVASNVAKVVSGARTLGIPSVVTEQYPRGLGTTVSEVEVDREAVLEKTVFAASRAEGFDLGGRSQALVCGIEAHICVHQTAMDLLARGHEVHILTDAVSSRDPKNTAVAIERATNAGAVPTTTEMALFELCERAGTPEFKEVQRLIK